MQITNNLNNDISAAAEWFIHAINIKPSEKILESEKDLFHIQYGQLNLKIIIFLFSFMVQELIKNGGIQLLHSL